MRKFNNFNSFQSFTKRALNIVQEGTQYATYPANGHISRPNVVKNNVLVAYWKRRLTRRKDESQGEEPLTTDFEEQNTAGNRHIQAAYAALHRDFD